MPTEDKSLIVIDSESPPLPPGTRLNKAGIPVDIKTGRWVKGVSANPEAHGQRPARLKSIDDFLRRRFGDNAEGLVEELAMIATYDPEDLELYVDEQTGTTKSRKKRSHYYTASHKLRALELLASYYFGKPREYKEVNKNVIVTKRVADLTKLINDNADRLKIVNGGKNK